MKISRVIRLLIGYVMIVYVLRGIVYAYNADLIYGHRFLAVLAVLSMVIEWLIVRGKLYYRVFGDQGRQDDIIKVYNLNKLDVILISVITACGGVMRIIGFDWGRVASWQADERKLTDAPINMVNYHIPYLVDVYYPNQFISKIVAVVVYICKKVMNVQLDTASSVWVTFVFRIIVGLCGTATIFVAFLIGNHFRKHLGCVFALLVAIYPYYIDLSKQVTGDVTVLMFLAVVMLASVRYIECRGDRYFWMMAAAAAMATMEKWHGAVGIGYIGVVLIICSNSIRDYVIKGFKAVGIYLLTLLIIAPNVIADPVRTINDGFINIAVYDGSEGAGYFDLLGEYIQYGHEYVFGFFGLVVMVVGAVWIIRNIDRRFVFLLLGPLKVMCLCFLNRSFPRWGFELYFSELFIASVGIGLPFMEAERVKSKSLRYAVSSVISIFALIMMASMCSSSWLTIVASVSNDKDSRLIQREDCRKLGITPDNMASQYYSGFAPASRCDSEYPGLEIKTDVDWEDYIYSVDGDLYRKNYKPEYICLCPSHYEEDRELQILLNKKRAAKILEYNTVCSDVFFTPFSYGRATLNEFDIISNNASLIKQIQQGALIGEDITIYDLTVVPVDRRATSD